MSFSITSASLPIEPDPAARGTPTEITFQGKKVHVEGSSEFTNYVIDNLNKIVSTDIGKELIDNLYNSGRSLNICEITDISKSPYSAYRQSDQIFLHPDKIKELISIIKLKDDKKVSYSREKTSDPSVVLFHEIVHLYYGNDPHRNIPASQGKTGVKHKGYDNREERYTIAGSKVKYGERNYKFYENAYRKALGLPARHLHSGVLKSKVSLSAETAEEKRVLSLIHADAVDSIKGKKTEILKRIDKQLIKQALLSSDSAKMVAKIRTLRPELFSDKDTWIEDAIDRKASFGFIHALADAPSDYTWMDQLEKSDWIEAIDRHDSFLYKHPEAHNKMNKKITILDQIDSARNKDNYQFLKLIIERADENQLKQAFEQYALSNIVSFPYADSACEQEMSSLLMRKAKALFGKKATMDAINSCTIVNKTDWVKTLSHNAALSQDEVQKSILSALQNHSIFGFNLQPIMENPIFPFLEEMGITSQTQGMPKNFKNLYTAYEGKQNPNFDINTISGVVEALDYSDMIAYIRDYAYKLPANTSAVPIPQDLFDLLLDPDKLNHTMLFTSSLFNELYNVITALKDKNMVISEELKQTLPRQIQRFASHIDLDLASIKEQKEVANELLRLVS